jgi:hypothetical protein
MTKKGLIWFVIVWCILTLISYYSFILISGALFIIISGATFLLSLFQLVKLIFDRDISKLRIQKAIIFIVLFLLTFFRWADSFIEKVDWNIFYNKRTEIVKEVKNNQLRRNASWNNELCQLPFEFPIVSTDGNDIFIIRDSLDGSLTVKFFILRAMYDDLSDFFVYTDNKKEIERMERLCKNVPKRNWKLKDNWYRIQDY